MEQQPFKLVYEVPVIKLDVLISPGELIFTRKLRFIRHYEFMYEISRSCVNATLTYVYVTIRGIKTPTKVQTVMQLLERIITLQNTWFQ